MSDARGSNDAQTTQANGVTASAAGPAVRVPPRHAGQVDPFAPVGLRGEGQTGNPPVRDGDTSTEIFRSDVERTIQKPLTRIRTALEQLTPSGDSNLSEAQTVLVAQARDEVVAIQTNVDRLFSGRSEASNTPPGPDLRPTDVAAALDRAGRSMNLGWRAGESIIETVAAEEIPLVHSDPDFLHECFLLALESMAANGSGAVLRVGAAVTDESVRIWLQNDHAGADAASDRLATARDIIEALGGSIDVEVSDDTRRLFLTLPREAAN